MRIVLIAQEFSHRGGAEKAACEQYRLLAQAGHEVLLVGDFAEALPNARGLQVEGLGVRQYADLQRQSAAAKLRVALKGLLNFALCWRVWRFLAKARPDVVHLHKVKQFSPLLYVALRLARVPVVATLHDHYASCPNSTRIQGDGSYCGLDRCSPGVALKKRCVGGSAALTGYALTELALRRHVVRDLGVVKRYLFPSQFLQDWTLRSVRGMNGVVVRNFAQDAAFDVHGQGARGHVLYFGRLSTEKGVAILPRLAHALPEVELRVVGDGPLRATIERDAQVLGAHNLRLLGALHGEALAAQIRTASVVIVPSVCFENAPLAVLESFMHGTPVVASAIGGLPELVLHEVTGLLFRAGDAVAAAEQLRRLLGTPELRERLGREARAQYMARFTPAAHVAAVMDIYRSVGARG